MKHKSKFLSIVILFAFLIFASCTQTTETKTKTTFTNNNNTKGEEKAETIVKDFFEAYNNHDFDKITTFYHKDMLVPLDNILKKLSQNLGKIKSFEKYNFKQVTLDGEAGIELYYKCKYENFENNIYVNLFFLTEDDENKIAGFTYNENKDIIDNYNDYLAKVEQTAKKLHDYLKNNNINEINTLLDEESVINAGYAEGFLESFQELQNNYVKANCSIYNNQAKTMVDGIQSFVLIYKCIKNDNSEFYEKLLLLKRGNDYKIAAYKIEKSLEEL